MIPNSLQKELDKTIVCLNNTEELIDNLSTLLFGRDIVLVDDNVIMPYKIIYSAAISLESVIDCCKNFRIADVNTLLRKYRDDLFFSLYIICYGVDENHDPEVKKNINLWCKNKLSNLKTIKILNYITKTCKEAVTNFGLEGNLRKISKKLNNYVHGNGKIYYNERVTQYADNELLHSLCHIQEHINYITITFLFLLTLCAPHLISSTDYVDCLEAGITPSNGEQYWVAPFIERYFATHLNLISKEALKYLKENTYMKFEL